MLADYRRLLAERGYDWGGEIEASVLPLFRLADRCDAGRWNAAVAEWTAKGTLPDPIAALLAALAEPVPSGIAVLSEDGALQLGKPLPYALPGRLTSYEVILAARDGVPGRLVEMPVSASHPYIEVGGQRATAVEPRESGTIRLRAGAPSRWSVVDERGGGWFPPTAQVKYDSRAAPYFHGDDLLVEVPTGRVFVTVGRGCEFAPATASVEVAAGRTVVLELAPRRLYDAAARGWYAADLHVHMNYTGDLVWEPEQALMVQRGEGLHLMNLVAANYSTGLVYDRELLEQFSGQDLPGSNGNAVARIGLEYRNDVYGHFHALNPAAPPTRYNTGHSRSAHTDDWPPNATAAAELKALGATIGYTHPLTLAPDENDFLDQVFARDRARSYEAREVVADAALGLVDSIDLLTGNVPGNEYLYHRLLGCGLRLAATAGSDVMLSRSRGRLTSNPPGWSRAYAWLGSRPLSVEAWQAALRACRTFVTNGPWLELDVAGRGPGETVAWKTSTRLPVRARAKGQGMASLEIVGPTGNLASAEPDSGSEEAELFTEIVVEEPTWVAAVVRGGPHPLAVGGRPRIYAHTSPAWIEVAGRTVTRRADAQWCLEWLDRFERLAQDAGSFSSPGQLADLISLLDRARTFYRRIVAEDR